MDVFSHGLWSGAAAKAANIKFKTKFRIKWAVFWGILPDLLGFGILFVVMFFSQMIGKPIMPFSHPENMEPAIMNGHWVFIATNLLYNISHSLFIFALVFALSCLWLKKPIWEMSAWLLHILIDIPTHSYQFYPTPFLWPFSGYKFNGFAWGNKWFMIINYSLIIIAYLLLYFYQRKKNKL